MIKIGDYVITKHYTDNLSIPSLVIGSLEREYSLVLIDDVRHCGAWLLTEGQIEHYSIRRDGELINNIEDYFGQKVYWYYSRHLILAGIDIDLILPNGSVIKDRVYPKLGVKYKQFEIAEISEDKTTAWLEYINE